MHGLSSLGRWPVSRKRHIRLTLIDPIGNDDTLGRASPPMLLRPPAALSPAVLCAALLTGRDGGGGGEPQMHDVHMAMLPSRNDPAMAKRWDNIKALVEKATGLPTKLYQADYNGTIQAITSTRWTSPPWPAGLRQRRRPDLQAGRPDPDHPRGGRLPRRWK
jgi:hypothetical protein